MSSVRTNVPYGPHPLQTLDVCHQNSSPAAPWLIYIHGGAWRDPLITKSTAHPLLHHILLTHPTLNAATLNYRLSPHPDQPQAAARHPDHLNDVLSGILYLRDNYGVAPNRVVLVGHSAGATLVFQVLPQLGAAGLWPAAVVGVEGIYDLVGLVDEYPGYAGFVEGAFGEREKWSAASPGWEGCTGYRGRTVLVHSDDDELLSWRQSLAWRARIEGTRGRGGKGQRVRLVRARGLHDEVPEGRELAGVVSELVGEMTIKETEVRHML
ncbi:uncharacterized protein H6S33_007486 [Morchella sextelata]|uniref:uncharacterized protein n=1 Tax=Morchella sextelata TaxID=1174677 RepID=UPI001D05943D|nr:uncharacterized protein H6S33_007486 [Morchella sextelata]KAH0603827.1 hypothetical protein H6S33_007486 [Morchella sextelata]